LGGALRLTAMRDTGDAWGGESNVDFNTPLADFAALTPGQVGAQWAGEDAESGPALRVLPSIKHPALRGERGSVSVTVEALSGWRNSLASIQVSLHAEVPHVDIKVRLHLGDRRKMIKLVLPVALPDPDVRCEVPYGIAERPADGTENACNRWLTLASGGFGVGVANNGQYAFAVDPDGTLGLSLARGAVHTRWGDQPIEPDEQHTFMDQGQIDTAFRLLVGAPEAVSAAIIPLALELNQPLDLFAVFYPPMPRLSGGDAARSFLSVSPATVQVGALKKADGENALILRLVESAGADTDATLTVDGLARAKRIAFRAHEIKTFKITRAGQAVRVTACELRE
jgi:alpha-mannosidase